MSKIIRLGVGFKLKANLRSIIAMRLVVVENGYMGLKNLDQCSIFMDAIYVGYQCR